MPKLVKHQGKLIVEMPAIGWNHDEMPVLLDDLITEAATKSPLVIVDLSTSRIIPGSVLGVLVRNWQRLRNRGGNMVLIANDLQREVFDITVLDRIFTLTDSRDEAVHLLGASA